MIILKVNNIKRRVVFIAVALFLTLFVSCEKKAAVEVPLVLPPTPIITNDQSWAVVIENYLKVTAEMDRNSSVVATLRKGAVLEILSSKVDRSTSQLWYQVKRDDVEGWVESISVKQFENREQAETAGRDSDRDKN